MKQTLDKAVIAITFNNLIVDVQKYNRTWYVESEELGIFAGGPTRKSALKNL